MANNAPQAMGNPAVRPNRLSLHSRSSSRQYNQARDFDPILRNLSPTTTLRAFSETGHLTAHDTLQVSLQNTTHPQRTLGVKAAQTCLDVRSWTRELEDWQWPGTFEVPKSETSHATNLADEDKGLPAYWGSLPATMVEDYELRADEIVRQLDDIDVEELKDFVLSAHYEAGNVPAAVDDSIGAIGAATDLRRLDDFTAIITATILQALPYLSRLNRMLDTWTIRLAILRQTPGLLKALAVAHADLARAWATLDSAPSTYAEPKTQGTFNRGTMIEQQSIIEHKVSSLGRRIDRILDDLEGRSETVPDSWIEEMETLERHYADWTVQAERKILEYDLMKRRSRIASPGLTQANGALQRNTTENGNNDLEHGTRPGLLNPPALSQSSSTHFNGTTPAHTPSVTSQTISPTRSYSPAAASMLELARDDSNTIPPEQADSIVERNSTSSNANSRMSSRSKRHVPIMLPYDGGDGQEYPTDGITGDLVSRAGLSVSDAQSTQSAPVAPSNKTPPSSFGSSVAKKRAMFSGDIERTQSLQRATKSPVRPFEHASNAFARLFKSEASSPERSRSNSKSSVHRKSSASNKTDNGVMWGGRTPPSVQQSPRRRTLEGVSQDARSNRSRSLNGSPVAADADAPPVPGLPSKSPRRSLQSPVKRRPQELEPSPTFPIEQNKTEPFPGFDFGENWPLTPPDTSSEQDSQVARFQAQAQDDTEGPGLASPKKPFESDCFDRMFIDCLPGTPENAHRAPSPDNEHTVSITQQDIHTADLPSEGSDPSRAQSPFVETAVPTIDPSMLDSSPELIRRPAHEFLGQPTSTPPDSEKPGHIDLPATTSLPVPVDKRSGPVTPNSVASDTYSPEIQEARASYFQMASPSSQPSLSRTTSAADATSPDYHRPLSSQMDSPERLEHSPQNGDRSMTHDAADDKLIRRASGISLEVKTIDLTRRKSTSSALELDASKGLDAPSSPVTRKDTSTLPTPPTIEEERPRSPVSPLPHSPGQQGLRHKTSNLSVVSDQAYATPEQGTLNSFMNKRRGPGLQHNETPVQARTNKKPEPDSFDRHVSEVLQRLPSAIHFRTGATTPQPRNADTRTFSGPRPKMNPRLSSRASGALTLAPADPSPNRRTPAANEPEVKLYHLTQAGREDPIKLFVRLVGEGDRVMVRVGGGWADLADYLRQYAEHHGSRTVSGEIDVKAVSTPTPAGGNSNIHPALRRKISGPLAAEVSRSRAGSPALVMPVREEQHEDLEKENADPSISLLTTTPSRPSLPPRSPSRPSTADSNRPGSKHSWSEMSMAGPGSGNKKAAELPEQKAKWVEGMVDLVQKASAEKKGEGQKQKYFGELGKVGGTRRVIFNRSASSQRE